MKARCTSIAAVALGALSFLLAPCVIPAADTLWRYVVPSPGDPHEHPPLRVLALSSEKPDDLKETVHYRGSRQRYAQLRYGNPRSVRVVVVLDEIAMRVEVLYAGPSRRK